MSDDPGRARHLAAVMAVPLLVGCGLIAGFLREMVLAYLFGTSRDIEVFRIAFGLPSILSDSLAVSFVSTLIAYRLAARSRPAQAFRGALWASVAIAALVAALGMLTMPQQARLLAPGIEGADRELLVDAGRICWLMFLAVILSLPLRAAMSLENRIWPGAASQLMRSGGFVVAIVAAAFLLGQRTVEAAAIAALAAGATVLAVHLLALGRRGRRRLGAALGAGPALRALGPLLGALGVIFATQLLLNSGRVLDRAIASDMQAGTLAAIEYSYALLMAVAAVIGTSTNLVLAPRIGRAIRDRGRVTRRYWLMIGAAATLATAAGLGLAALAEPVVRLVYQRGTFGEADALLTAGIFEVHALGLGPLVLALILTQVLLLLGGQTWGFVLALAKFAVKAAALWILLGAGYGLLGLTISLGLTEAAMALLLGLAIRRRQGRPGRPPRRPWQSPGRLRVTEFGGPGG